MQARTHKSLAVPFAVTLIAALCSIAFAAAAEGAPIGVTDQPIASFTSSPAQTDVGHPVTFDATASKDPDGEAIMSYQWTFGDGVTQTTSSPLTTHVYTASGSYTVVLTVLDVNGNPSAPVTHAIKIAVDKPTARFSSKPAVTVAGKAVSFDGSTSSDSDGDAIASYQWSFGDGSTQTTSGPSTSHVYAAAGTFTATLTVIDSHGNSSAAVSHKINAPTQIAPTARFGFSPAHPVTGQLLTFNASASTATDGAKIKSYRWTFGDRSSETTTAPSIEHTYAQHGTFTVSLVVTDSRGSHSKTTSQKLTVELPPPRITNLHVRACVRHSRRCHLRGLYVRFGLSARDQVVLTVKRRHHRRTLRRVVITGRPGRNVKRIQIQLAHMRPGHYVLSAQATGGGTASTRFVWRG